jgi:hypothetical protein
LGVSKKSKQSIFAVLAQGAVKADPLWKKSLAAKSLVPPVVLAMPVDDFVRFCRFMETKV